MCVVVCVERSWRQHHTSSGDTEGAGAEFCKKNSPDSCQKNNTLYRNIWLPPNRLTLAKYDNIYVWETMELWGTKDVQEEEKNLGFCLTSIQQ